MTKNILQYVARGTTLKWGGDPSSTFWGITGSYVTY